MIARSELPSQSAEYLFSVVCRAFPPSRALNGHPADRSWAEPVERCLALLRTCESALGSADAIDEEDAILEEAAA